MGCGVKKETVPILFKLICIANIRYHIKHRNILKCIKFEWKFKIFQVNVSPDFNVIHFYKLNDLKNYQNSLFQSFSPLQHKNITILYGFQGWRILPLYCIQGKIVCFIRWPHVISWPKFFCWTSNSCIGDYGETCWDFLKDWPLCQDKLKYCKLTTY